MGSACRTRCESTGSRGANHQQRRPDRQCRVGQAGAWVDYHGPVEGETLGVAILNHPSSFRFPTYWHVRTYGLFTANPFGVRSFTGDKTQDGSYTLPAGATLTFRYRVLFHRGDEEVGKVAAAYDAYSKQAK